MTNPRKKKPAERLWPLRSPSLERGALGESLAARHLQALGFSVEARNLRTRLGEIDLLVRRRRLWVAVEVKTRSFDPAPEQAVDAKATARLRRALRALVPTLRPRPRQLRIDVVAVRLRPEGPEVRHFEGEAEPPPSGEDSRSRSPQL
ncbi:MAG: YraN family protein [Planctomycetota bacterium]